MNETIKGNIGVSIDTSWFGSLFFTADKLIVARTEQKRFSQEETSLLTRFILQRFRGKEIEVLEDAQNAQVRGYRDPQDNLTRAGGVRVRPHRQRVLHGRGLQATLIERSLPDEEKNEEVE